MKTNAESNGKRHLLNAKLNFYNYDLARIKSNVKYEVLYVMSKSAVALRAPVDARWHYT